MPPWTRVADGLWHALCPSFYRLHPLKLWSDPKLTKRTTPRYFHTQPTLNTPGTGHQRTKNSGKKGNRLNKSEDFFFSGHSVELNASGEAIVLARGVRKPHGVTERSNRRPSWGTFTPNTKLPGRGALSSDRSTDENGTSDGGKWHANREASQQATIQTPNLDLEVRGFKARHGRGYRELNQEELHGELRRTSTAGDYPRSQEILRILIQDRGEKPSRRHFQALLLANTSAQHGSAAGIIGTVQEMEEAGITMDSAAYHAVLRVWGAPSSIF